jgi:hypothetical protein
LNHLRAPVLAAIAVAAAAAMLDVLLALLLGHTPGWLCGAFDAAVLNQFGSRLARAEQLQTAGQINASQLITVLGLSPVREDCDPVLLADNDPEHRDWLILGAQGRTFATLDVYARILADSGVHPREVVLGIMPSMLHQDDHAAPVDAAISRLPHHLRHLQINHVLLDLSWLYRNRDSLADEATLAMYESAAQNRLIFGLPMSATFAPESGVFSSWTSVFDDHSDAAHMALQWQGHQQLLDPAQFQSIGRQGSALASLVGRLRRGGATVTIVLMPETSRLRSIYPPIVEQKFDDALNAAAAGILLKIIDMRGSIGDDLFWDDGHLNPQGRRLFSARLPGLLR